MPFPELWQTKHIQVYGFMGAKTELVTVRFCYVFKYSYDKILGKHVNDTTCVRGREVCSIYVWFLLHKKSESVLSLCDLGTCIVP